MATATDLPETQAEPRLMTREEVQAKLAELDEQLETEIEFINLEVKNAQAKARKERAAARALNAEKRKKFERHLEALDT